MAVSGASSALNRMPSRTTTSQTRLPPNESGHLVEEDSPVSFEDHNLAWNKFEEENISMLRQLTAPELESTLANTLNLEDYKLSLTDGAKLDYFVGGFLFCSEQNFGFFQTSSFMGTLDKLLNNCQSEMTLEDNIAEFVTYIREMNNLEQNTSSGIEGFTTEQSKKVIDFVHQGLFQHYSLYQYFFQNEQTVDTMDKMLDVEVVPPGNIPFPPPLHEGIPLELYEKYVAPPTTILDEMAGSEDMVSGVPGETSGAMEKEASERKQSEQVNAAELILKSLKPEEIKDIVAKITEETLQNVKMETDSKIKEKEAAMVSKINKIHLT